MYHQRTIRGHWPVDNPNVAASLPPMEEENMARPFRHGIFLAPFHATDENPTIAIQRDLELVEWLEKLGFDEAWIGEHHSGGFEIIDSPELFIAAAAERTKRIRFGTGVVSLPYHNPFMVASRLIQLDHMTQGRVAFGFGPGSLVSDAKMLGIDPNHQREMMSRAVDVIIRLMKGETVTEESSWFKLVEAKLHLPPYTFPFPELAVASSVTPSGANLAGRYGIGLLCVAATNPAGYEGLATNWQIAVDAAAANGHKMDEDKLRLVCPMHIAESRDQARENVAFGFENYVKYYNNHQHNLKIPAGADPIQWFIENRYGVIGTPDDVIEMINRLRDKQGNFGYFLQQAHNWADWSQTKRSYELYARYVVPHFTGANKPRKDSMEWNRAHRPELEATKQQAIKVAFAKHKAEQQKD
jgi:limonene 1,2-monooxygenase